MKVKQLFESQFDTLSISDGIFYIYKNPTNKEFIERHKNDENNRGVIDSNGNLYIVTFFPKTHAIFDNQTLLHDDLISHLQKKHNIFTNVNSEDGCKYQSQIILVQQESYTYNYYLSELYLVNQLKSSKIQEILNKAKVKNPHLNFIKKRISDSTYK